MNFKSVVTVAIHLGIAYFLSWVAKKMFDLQYSEVLVTYFVVLATRYLSMLDNFAAAYIAAPDEVEKSLREMRDNVLNGDRE